MLRAVLFATNLRFTIHSDCEAPIKRLAGLLPAIPPARLYDETLKLFLSGYAIQTFEQLRHYQLFGMLFPDTEKSLTVQHDGFPLTFLAKALENTDKRLQEGKPVTPYFLFAALLWEPVRAAAEAKVAEEGATDVAAIQEAAQEVIVRQVKRIAFPRRIGMLMREVWILQSRFNKRSGSRPFRLLAHPRFRAAYDFLVLRAETGEADPSLAEWWTRFQEVEEAEQKRMTRGLVRKPRRRRRKKREAGQADSSSS